MINKSIYWLINFFFFLVFLFKYEIDVKEDAAAFRHPYI